MQMALNQSIMHFQNQINCACIIWDTTLVQLTVFIFYRERCLELLNVHSVMLNDLLCFIFLT